MYNFTPEFRHLRSACSMVALAVACVSAPAFAQTTPNAATAAPPDVPSAALPSEEQGRTSNASDIVVTGSRIIANGFNAPTPTTVIGEEQIANNAQPNIFTTIQQLP